MLSAVQTGKFEGSSVEMLQDVCAICNHLNSDHQFSNWYMPVVGTKSVAYCWLCMSVCEQSVVTV